jgi:radical SAM protein with 4Fe4S-binding SPASM domain
MYQYSAACDDEQVETLPGKTRPWLRYRPEVFGYLAAFPSGHVRMYREGAKALLGDGASEARCTTHLLERLSVPTTFHFSAPLMAWLEITRQCNLRCPHCFVEGGTKRASEISTETILALLDEWAEMGVFSVVITGGEPTIHPDFVEIVNQAQRLGFVVGIATNGIAMTERLLSRIPQNDVIISLSLDEIHGQGASHRLSDFDYVTRRLLEIRDSGFNTSIMTTTTSQNIRELRRIIRWAIENDVSLRSVPCVPMGRAVMHPELVNTPEDVDLAAEFWIEEEKWERIKDGRLGLCSGKVFNFLLTMSFATHRCMSGRGICYVNSSGDVYPCSTCSGNKVLCAGNLRMASFREIWESEDWEIRGITWDVYRKTCDSCPIDDEKYFCTGRCPGSSSVLTGRFDGCGTTNFQRQSILRREALFRKRVRLEPRVEVKLPTIACEEGPNDRNPIAVPMSTEPLFTIQGHETRR